MKILWQTQSQALHDAMRGGAISEFATGGNTYDFMAAQSLKAGFQIDPDIGTVKKPSDNYLSFIRQLAIASKPHADILIKSPMVVTFGKRYSDIKDIGIVHHLDAEGAKRNIQNFMYLKALKSKLRNIDCLVCVSEYWKHQFINLGANRVEVIYNSFDLKEFTFSSKETEEFKEKYSLNTNSPLIYVGNSSKGKGVEEVCKTLNGKSLTLISSGRKSSNYPVRCLSLNRREYLLLLSVSDVVLTMSTMPEGWNRTAHEAMLCRTPVIGSGSGGMRELLEGGQQRVLTNLSKLPSVISEVLENPGLQGDAGYDYCKKFDLTYFARAWTSLVRDVGRN